MVSLCDELHIDFLCVLASTVYVLRTTYACVAVSCLSDLAHCILFVSAADRSVAAEEGPAPVDRPGVRVRLRIYRGSSKIQVHVVHRREKSVGQLPEEQIQRLGGKMMIYSTARRSTSRMHRQ